MYALLGLVAFIGLLGSLVWLIISLVKKMSKRIPLTSFAVCFLVFVACKGVSTNSENSLETNSTSKDTTHSTPSSNLSKQESSTLEATSEGIEFNSESSSSAVQGNLKSGTYSLSNGVELHFSNSVRNDVTGKWRISATASSAPPMNYAFEYYKTMFSSDEEIHAIWNATLGTTTRILCTNGLLFVDTLEYVDGEEHDANLLFSGMLLDSQIFNASTGEAETIE